MSCESFDARQLRLARQVLDFSRRRITAEVPAMLAAVYALSETPREEPGPMGTDGVHLFFHPAQVLDDFKQERYRPARELLHLIFHCLLGHLERRGTAEDKEVFDALADYKADAFVRQFKALDAPERWEEVWGSDFDGVGLFPFARDLSRPLAPLYREFLGESAEVRESLLEYTEEFRVDDHSAWENPQGFLLTLGAVGRGEGDAPPDWDAIRQTLCYGSGGKLPGTLPGTLTAELSPAEENGIHYDQFLRRFAAPNERLQTDPDSLDPRWYHLGLERYGDMPIPEPCEVSEPPVPDDLVIALDTSGSCSDDVCRRFLRETLNLLEDISAGSGCFRVLLLQCDTDIRDERLLENRDQVESLMDDFTPRGFGGTDFCPVFRRVEELRASGALPRVRGLLYLSDGFGDFPNASPDYPVVFLTPKEEDFLEPEIPNWVTTLILDCDHFTVKEAENL